MAEFGEKYQLVIVAPEEETTSGKFETVSSADKDIQTVSLSSDSGEIISSFENGTVSEESTGSKVVSDIASVASEVEDTLLSGAESSGSGSNVSPATTSTNSVSIPTWMIIVGIAFIVFIVIISIKISSK